MNFRKLLLATLISTAILAQSASTIAQVIGSERLCDDPIVDAYYYQDGHTEWDVPDRGEAYRRLQFIPFVLTNPEPTPTPEETARGYITFSPAGRIGVLQEYRPAASEITSSTSIFAAPGEYDPATFAIRPLSDLGTVTFVCNDFTGPGGATISASNIDTYIVEPTAETMYHASDPGAGGDKIRWVPKWLRPGNTAQATTLKNIQVYADIHVPADQTPGIYSGSVAVQIGGATVSSFAVTLEVLPFELERAMSWGLFRYGWGDPIDRAELHRYELGEMHRIGMSECVISPLDYQNHPGVYSDGSVNAWMYDQSIDLYKEAGFEDPPVVAMEALMYFIFAAKGVLAQYPFSDIYTPTFTADSVDAETRAFAGLVLQNLYDNAIEKDWPTGTYFYFADEPAVGPGRMECAKFMYGVAREYVPQMKTAGTAYSIDDATALSNMLDLDIIRYENTCQTAYNAWYLNYAETQNVILHGLSWLPEKKDTFWEIRMLTFQCEKAGLDGITSWTQWISGAEIENRPFNGYIFAPQTWRGGPWFMKDQSSITWFDLPWIGIREGIDDSRYVRTVRALIDEADAVGATTAADSARTVLQQVLNEVLWVNDPRDPSTWTSAHADTERLALANAAKNLLTAMAPVYVNKNAPGPTHNGQSWSTAYLTVQEGINAAPAGRQVWVASGTYVERITLKANVSVYGGFAGTETKKSQRNPRTNITILDGSAGGSVVTVSAGVMGNTVIDGFTIRNGYGMRGGVHCGSSSPTIRNNIITGNTATTTGGGIYCGGGSPKISNNVIVSNNGQYGGGIYCYNSNALILNNTLVSNTATYAGGIYCDNSSPTIGNNIIVLGSSGIYSNGGAPALRNNNVYGNTAYNYSGLSAGTEDISVDPLFVNGAGGDFHLRANSQCVNAGYNSWVDAGAVDMDGETRVHGTYVDIGVDEVPHALVIYVDKNAPGPTHNGQTWATAYLTVQDGLNAATSTPSEIWVADGTYAERITLKDGVALYGGFSDAETVRDQRDWNANPTILDGSAGGRVVSALTGVTDTAVIDGFVIQNGSSTRGGGVYCDGYSTPTISNNLITGNSATGTPGAGGGVYCYQASPKLYNNLIVLNSAKYGGGIYCYSSSAAVTNNTIVSNTGTTNGGAVYCDNSSAAFKNNIAAFNTRGIYKTGTASPTLQNNCVYGNTSYDYSGLSAGSGDISTDPLFVDRPAGDYHIQTLSPCVDAGDDSAVQTEWLDMDCQARIFGAHVDIGADEAPYYTITGKVTLEDYIGDITQVPVTIELHNQNDGSITTRIVNPDDSSGNFTLSRVAPGTYDLAIKASHWLQKVVPDVLVGP